MDVRCSVFSVFIAYPIATTTTHNWVRTRCYVDLEWLRTLEIRLKSLIECVER